MSLEQRIIDIIKADEIRMRALLAARSLNLPDWLIAAGFVRDLIWGSIYGTTAELQDIDVIYFCPADSLPERDTKLEEKLLKLEPSLPWSVKNQARMHFKNGDEPYLNTLDAMSFWPEQQTCIGVMLDKENQLIVRHCFDLSLQFNDEINPNPKRSLEIFNNRVLMKQWQKKWPALQIKI